MPGLVTGWPARSGVAIGYFGKLPTRGDFVAKDLPESFLTPFSEWLEPCLAGSREALGRRWAELYLVSPAWFFALSPGVCGPNAVAGALVPSVDRTKREFPFIIAACMGSDIGAAVLASIAGGWLDGIGEIAVAAVTRNVELSRLEAAIRGHKGRLDDLPEPPESSLVAGAIRLSGSVGADVRLALPYLLDRKAAAARAYSLWWSKGSALVESSVVLCDGLPSAERFPAFIDGRWGQRGW